MQISTIHSYAKKIISKLGIQYGYGNEISVTSADYYKKELYPNAPEDLKPYILAKNFSFTYRDINILNMNTPLLIDEMRLCFDIARPMYDFMLKAYCIMLDEGLIKPEE